MKNSWDRCILLLHLDGVRSLNATQTFELIQSVRLINKVKQFSVVPAGKSDKSKPDAVGGTPLTDIIIRLGYSIIIRMQLIFGV